MLCQFSLYNQANHLYVYLYPLLDTPPTAPIHQSKSPQSTKLCSLHYTAGSHPLFYTWQWTCVNPNLPVYPTLSFLPCVHTSVLYICVSILALQIGSSVPFFWIPHMRYIRYLFFSFWLTLLLFMYLLAIYMSSLENVYSNPLPIF